ncbi:hypothetical protein CGLO_18297 [Colletotrichum gloeosporioides Cg-14]|uniref:Uncharacterized protein n=1 Tax=Colletotrichum gloeosporioides (strain Cg-14) TaxID=1237896 RepID=T0JRW1_COLGC|nr:hypothetical protein CGLO_18297 [Colletotrichum gloeosporioides Cg-14]
MRSSALAIRTEYVR